MVERIKSNEILNESFWESIVDLTEQQQIGFLRNEIYENNTNFRLKNKPLWVFFVQNNLWIVLDELLSQSKEILSLIDIDYRDYEQRGWLHYAIYNDMPENIAIKGLRLLNENWSHPDIYGITPMEALPKPKLAQQMAAKWWSENGNSGKELFEKLLKGAKNTNREDLVRVWSFWANAKNK